MGNIVVINFCCHFVVEQLCWSSIILNLPQLCHSFKVAVYHLVRTSYAHCEYH